MATVSFKDTLIADKGVQRVVAEIVRSRYGIQPDRDCRIEIRDAFASAADPYGDFAEEVIFTFDSPRQGLPLNVTSLLDKVAEKLHDPFRGPVVQAAVPELHADVVALLEALKKLDQPFRVAMKLKAVQDLLGRNP